MTNSEAKRRLADWFHRWRPPLRKFLMGRSALPAADLDDVAQEVFLRLLRYERTELVEHPQAYLFKIATNVAAEWAIRARSSRPHEPKWLTDLVAEDQPEEDVARGSANAEIERALNTLGPRQREVLKLKFTEDLGYDEIAARLGATPRSVKRILMRSYEKLRHQLEPDLFRGSERHGRK